MHHIALLSASFIAVLVLCTALVSCSEGAASPSADKHADAGESNFSMEQAKAFADLPVHAPGKSFDELPLTGVVRRFDSAARSPPVRANLVGFLYGSCQPGPDSGCTAPLGVEVWAACERNPGVYSPELAREGPVTVRGVTAYFYEGGRRRELFTGTSTVVIFARDREQALRAAAALERINNPIPVEEDLPAPAYITAVAEAGHNQHPRSVACARSDAFTQVGELTDFHNCEIV